MNDKLYIPKKLIIGFQNRKDTFTGKLAYITYYDNLGVLRKVKSWENWRDKNIKTVEVENTPIDGFIFNKGVERCGHWGSGRSVFRLHDPREFEFEIGVDNLIGLLMHSDVSKREIFEKCIYAWNGNSLVLLPVNSEEYITSKSFTRKKELSPFLKSSLVPGVTVSTRSDDNPLLYIGKYHYRSFNTDQANSFGCVPVDLDKESMTKENIFMDSNGKFTFIKNLKLLAEVTDSNPPSDFAFKVDEYINSLHYQYIKKINFKNTKEIMVNPNYNEMNIIKLNNEFFRINIIKCNPVNIHSTEPKDQNNFQVSIYDWINLDNQSDGRSYNLSSLFYNYHYYGYGQYGSNAKELVKKKVIKATAQIKFISSSQCVFLINKLEDLASLGIKFGKIELELDNGNLVKLK